MGACGLVLAGCATTSALPDQRPLVFLLMGQSNMSGRGALEGLMALERKANPHILVLANDDRVRPALDPLDDPTGQTDPVSLDREAGVGPGLFFARQIAAQRRRGVMLVPCAKGGSAIAQWAPGGSAETLFGSCLRRARLASATGELAGALWYQGESDAREAASARAWPEAYQRMLCALRTGLGRPDLPVVTVVIGDRPDTGPYAGRYPAWSLVQHQQGQLRLSDHATVSAAGLPRNPDQLHLSTAAQRTLGKRLARGLDRAEKQHSPPSSC